MSGLSAALSADGARLQIAGVPRRALILGAILTLVPSSPLLSQRAGVVLRLPASVRATGVADIGAAAQGAAALFYGPAGLDGATSAAVNVGGWLGGSTFGTAAMSAAWRGVAIGLGVRALDYGSADEIAPDASSGGTRGTPTGATISASEVGLVFGAARRVGPIRAGASIGYIRQSLVDATTDAVTGSVSLEARAKGWVLSTAALDASSGFRYGARTEPLGTTVRGAVQSPLLSLLGGSWVGVAEYRSVAGAGSMLAVGANGAWRTHTGWVLEARAGGRTFSSTTAQAPWSAGGSVGRGAISLDYAYQGFGVLGAVHRMGVTWRARPSGAGSR